MITGKILGEKYIINGQPADTADFNPKMTAGVYYEVVRLIDGKFLFLDDHLERFRHSLSGSGLEHPGDEIIRDNLRLLQELNEFLAGNIRICIRKKKENGSDLLSYFIPYYYPDEYTYLSGVQMVTYSYVRSNPGIKKWDNRFRVSVYDHIRNSGVYEAVLVNERMEVTEGSRSNIFFIDPMERVITPPPKDVLPGITRKYVIGICQKEAIEVIERPVLLSDLGKLTSCFISGTSPKVLPVCQLDSFQFIADHRITKIIMERFESLLQENLTDLRS